MKLALKLVIASLAFVALHEVLVRLMAHGHVAHSLLAGGPSLGAALLAVALVIVRFVAVVMVPGALATAAVLALAHYFVGSKSTGISPGAADAEPVADGAGTSMGATGTE